MKSKPDKADYFCFEAPEIVDCDESSTDWKRGRDYSESRRTEMKF